MGHNGVSVIIIFCCYWYYGAATKKIWYNSMRIQVSRVPQNYTQQKNEYSDIR